MGDIEEEGSRSRTETKCGRGKKTEENRGKKKKVLIQYNIQQEGKLCGGKTDIGKDPRKEKRRR